MEVLWDGVRIEYGRECVRCYVNAYMMQWVDIRWTWWGTHTGVASDEAASVVRKFAGSRRSVGTNRIDRVDFILLSFMSTLRLWNKFKRFEVGDQISESMIFNILKKTPS